jgi:hypothetical protein
MNRYRNNKTPKYPEIPLSQNDIYVISQKGDRFDILAQQYYSNPSYWWVISIANENLPQNSLFIPQGQQIRIPSNLDSILLQYDELN